MALADQYKSGRQSTPQDRMSGNTQKEQIRSNLSAGLGSSDVIKSKERADLSKQAQDYMDQQAGKKVINRGN